jgi:hypothetical protein
MLLTGSFLLSIVDIVSGDGTGKLVYIVFMQGIVMGIGMSCFFVMSSQGECTQHRTIYNADVLQWLPLGFRGDAALQSAA